MILLAIVTPFTLAILAISTIFTIFLGGASLTNGPNPSRIPQRTLLVYRFLAWILDLMLFTVAFVIFYPLIIFDISLLATFSPLFPLLSSWMIALFFFVSPLCFILANAYLECKTGQTPGKYLFCLKVITKDGSKPSFRQAVIRNFGRAFFTAIDVTGFLTASRVQRFTEKLARTTVVSAT